MKEVLLLLTAKLVFNVAEPSDVTGGPFQNVHHRRGPLGFMRVLEAWTLLSQELTPDTASEMQQLLGFLALALSGLIPQTEKPCYNLHFPLSLSAGENVKDFFFRVAALAFEKSVLMELQKSSCHTAQIGAGNLISRLSFACLGGGEGKLPG